MAASKYLADGGGTVSVPLPGFALPEMDEHLTVDVVLE
jgi:hypothetical protein